MNRRSIPVVCRHENNAVWLRVYDISNGKAAIWSELVLGRKVDGVWHTGIFVYGLEYFYGGGIGCAIPAIVERTFDMEIVESQLLGYTEKTKAEFEQFLRSIRDKFTPETYDLCEWNCNHFTDSCARFLLNDRGIPEKILDLPETIASSFVGDLILKFFKCFHRGRNPAVNSIDVPDHSRFDLECGNTQSSLLSLQQSSMSRSHRRSSSFGYDKEDESSNSSEDSPNGGYHHKSTFRDSFSRPPQSKNGRRTLSRTPAARACELHAPANSIPRSRPSHLFLAAYKVPTWTTSSSIKQSKASTTHLPSTHLSPNNCITRSDVSNIPKYSLPFRSGQLMMTKQNPSSPREQIDRPRKVSGTTIYDKTLLGRKRISTSTTAVCPSYVHKDQCRHPKQYFSSSDMPITCQVNPSTALRNSMNVTPDSSSVNEIPTLPQQPKRLSIHQIAIRPSLPISIVQQGVHLSVPAVESNEDLLANKDHNDHVTFNVVHRRSCPYKLPREQETKFTQDTIPLTVSLSDQSLSTAATTSSSRSRTPTGRDRDRQCSPKIPLFIIPSTCAGSIRTHQVSSTQQVHQSSERRQAWNYTPVLDSSTESSTLMEKGLIQGPSLYSTRHSNCLQKNSDSNILCCPRCGVLADRRYWMCDSCGFDFMTWLLR